MIKLNDYLYDGNTVIRILQNYISDLRAEARRTRNPIDVVHCNFLLQIADLLEHNDFLTAQSRKLQRFYKHIAVNYPFLAFTFRGRIKSLIRAEEKFNGYVVEFVYDYYKEHGTFPSVQELKNRLTCFRDLIAYRIVISLPKCQVQPGQDRRELELQYLYQIANELPSFLEDQGFNIELAGTEEANSSQLLNEDVRPYYRDYIQNPSAFGYQSLHITFYDTSARCYIEVQLRTKEMDDYAEIGPANHLGYEKRQEADRKQRDTIPVGKYISFDEAYERGLALQNLDLSKLDVNMFAAANNSLINDGCGLYRGRLILPYEHLSRFQND